MKKKDILQVLVKIFRVILLIQCIALFSYAFYVHYRVVVYPYQHELREAVTPMATQLMLEGGNPFKIDSQPEHAQAYGIVFNWLSYPVAHFFGASLETHRGINAVFIFLSILVSVLWMKHLEIDTIFVGYSSLLIYIALLYNVLPINRPDALGLFLMLLSMYLPHKYNFSRLSLLVSILITVVSFYAKSYFVLGGICVGSYLFFFVSKEKGLLYTLFFLIVFGVSAWSITLWYPLFFYTTVLSFLNYPPSLGLKDANWADHQFYMFGLLHRGLIGVVIILLAFALWKAKKRSLNINLNFNKLALPLFKTEVNHKIFFLYYTVVLFFLVLYFLLAKNIGAFLTYLFTHWMVFFFSVIFYWVTNTYKKLYVLIIPLLCINLLLSVRALLVSDLGKSEVVQWQKIEGIIKDHSKILASPAVAGLIYEQNKKVYYSGLTGQFGWAGKTDNRNLKQFFSRSPEIKAKYQYFKESINQRLTNGDFDVLLVEQKLKKQELLQYQLIDSIRVNMPQTAQSWLLYHYEKNENLQPNSQ